MQRKGEIGIGMLIGTFVTISIAVVSFLGNAINKADTKAQAALIQVTEMQGDIKAIKENVQWIKESLKIKVSFISSTVVEDNKN